MKSLPSHLEMTVQMPEVISYVYRYENGISFYI